MYCFSETALLFASIFHARTSLPHIKSDKFQLDQSGRNCSQKAFFIKIMLIDSNLKDITCFTKVSTGSDFKLISLYSLSLVSNFKKRFSVKNQAKIFIFWNFRKIHQFNDQIECFLFLVGSCILSCQTLFFYNLFSVRLEHHPCM